MRLDSKPQESLRTARGRSPDARLVIPESLPLSKPGQPAVEDLPMTSHTRILPGRYAFMLLFAALFAITGMLAGARRHAFADGGGGAAALKRPARSIPALPPGALGAGAQTASRRG